MGTEGPKCICGNDLSRVEVAADQSKMTAAFHNAAQVEFDRGSRTYNPVLDGGFAQM